MDPGHKCDLHVPSFSLPALDGRGQTRVGVAFQVPVSGNKAHVKVSREQAEQNPVYACWISYALPETPTVHLLRTARP